MENKKYAYCAFDNPEGIGLISYPQLQQELATDTIEQAVDHLKTSMILKASKLRLEADEIMDRLKAFEELERTPPSPAIRISTTRETFGGSVLEELATKGE